MMLDGAFAKALTDQMLDKGDQDGDNGFSDVAIRLVDHPAIGPGVEVWDIGGDTRRYCGGRCGFFVRRRRLTHGRSFDA